MLKQTLTFQSAVSLSLKDRQLVIKPAGDDTAITRPIEDIGVVVVENQMVRFTVPVINALAENNVAVVFCDATSMPRSILMSLDGNSTLQEIHRAQIEAGEPAKKRAWKQIVESKIKNQSLLLESLGLSGAPLRSLLAGVKSGDPDNREGRAARLYWSQIFGPGFRRDRNGEPPNGLLNYGYSILRAAVIRALVGSGLYPAFGIFHRNRYNAFPLADDIMEPYRPMVDAIVYDLYSKGCLMLGKEEKMTLQRVLVCDLDMGEVTRPLQVALSMTTASLAKYYKGDTDKLQLPVLK